MEIDLEANSAKSGRVRCLVNDLTRQSNLINAKIDYYLSKAGNPILLRRLIFTIFGLIAMYLLVAAGTSPFVIGESFADDNKQMEITWIIVQEGI